MGFNSGFKGLTFNIITRAKYVWHIDKEYIGSFEEEIRDDEVADI